MDAPIIEQIKQYRHADPFRPFKMKFDDGREILIDRPEFLGRFPTDDRIFYSTPEDTTEIVEVSRIRSVRVVRPAAGKRKRR